MKKIVATLAMLGAFASTSALAQNHSKPITGNNLSAVDIAKTPITDLNIDQKKIPVLLLDAEKDPYSRSGLHSCTSMKAAVSALDDILGPDIDLPQQERDRISAGRVAKMVVSSFIPFRGIIREVSGAREHEAEIQIAIQAGIARRSFIKGMGAVRGCAYPASPATAKVIAAYKAKFEAEDRAKAQQEAAQKKDK